MGRPRVGRGLRKGALGRARIGTLSCSLGFLMLRFRWAATCRTVDGMTRPQRWFCHSCVLVRPDGSSWSTKLASSWPCTQKGQGFGDPHVHQGIPGRGRDACFFGSLRL